MTRKKERSPVFPGGRPADPESAPFGRIVAYLLGGGLFLTWLDPSEGVFKYLVVLALIVAFAYLEAQIARRRPAAEDDGRVVSFKTFRARQKRRGEIGAGGRERRVFRPVYTSASLADADGLLRILRAEGLNPMMVTQSRGGGNAASYVVMLSDGELAKGKPIVDLHSARPARKPS